jgi:hypothetical protein
MENIKLSNINMRTEVVNHTDEIREVTIVTESENLQQRVNLFNSIKSIRNNIIHADFTAIYR